MIGIQLPDGRIVQIETDDPKAAAEAGKRIWSYEAARKEADAVTRLQSGPSRSMGQTQTFGFGDEASGAAAAATTFLKNTVLRAQGKEPAYGVKDMYAAARDSEREAQDKWAGEHPWANMGIGILGGLPGGAAGRVGTLWQTMRQGAAVGGVMGGVSGAGNARGGLKERATGAAKGAAVGGLTGAAVPFVVSKGAQTGRTVARAVNKATGGKLMSPEKEAARRLAEALARDKTTPSGSKPLLDAGGEETRALVRAASTQGPARTEAARYANTVAADLQDRAIGLTTNLTPDKRAAPELVEALKSRRGSLAATDYAGPYAEPVQLDDNLMTALGGEPGKSALRRARSAAVARMDDARVADFDRLLKPPTPNEAGVPQSLAPVDAPAGPLPTENPQGQSLLGFLRSAGGVRDAGGELSGRDLGRSRGGQFQRFGVANPNGLSMEEAAQRAWEAGFLPEVKMPRGGDFADNYSPATEQHLLDAIEREISGRPTADAFAREADDAASTRWMDDTPDPHPEGDDWWKSLNLSEGNPTVTAAALDRARIAMRERAQTASKNGHRELAAGLNERVKMIDAALDAVPGLGSARAHFKDLSGQIEGVPIGQTGPRAMPDDYAAKLAAVLKKSPNAKGAAGVGYRQALVDAIGAPTEGATGTLNRIATNTNQGRNLAETFGPDAAGQYRQAMGGEISRMENARFIDPRSGSKTASSLADADRLIGAMPSLNPMRLVGLAIDKVRRGATLTDAERSAILSIAISDGQVGSAAVQPFLGGAKPWLSGLLAAPVAREAGGAAGR